jgi:hypothetical protein
MSMADLRPAPEYSILCMYARALTEASAESSILTFHCDLGMARYSRAVWKGFVSANSQVPTTYGNSMLQPVWMLCCKVNGKGAYFCICFR